MERLEHELARQLRRLGHGPSAAQVVDVWREAVGAAVAAHAWPARMGRDGVLYVHTTSSAWAFELSQLSPVVEQRLGELLGADAPRRLRFVPGPIPSAGLDEGREEAPRIRPSAETLQEARALVAAVSDGGLAERIARAFALTRARREPGTASGMLEAARKS